MGQPGCRLQRVATVPTSFDVTALGLGSPACRGSQHPVVIGLSVSPSTPVRERHVPGRLAPFCGSRPPGVDLHWFPSRVLPGACGFPATPLTARPPHPVRQHDSRRQSSASPPHGSEVRCSMPVHHHIGRSPPMPTSRSIRRLTRTRASLSSPSRPSGTPLTARWRPSGTATAHGDFDHAIRAALEQRLAPWALDQVLGRVLARRPALGQPIEYEAGASVDPRQLLVWL